MNAMKKYIIQLFLLLISISLQAQDGGFNPSTPDEPGGSARVVLSAYPDGAGTVSGGGIYNVGSRINIRTSSAGAQWKFLYWRNKSTQEVINTNSSFYMNTVEGITRLEAVYEELVSSLLVVECNPKEANASRYGGGTYVEGTSVYVYCYNPTGFTFTNWVNKRTGEILSTSRYFYFTKTAEADTLVANFSFSPSTPSEPSMPIVYHNIYIGVNNAEAGYVSASQAQVIVGQTYTVSAYNKANYAFVGWMQGGAIVSTSATYTVTMGKKDISLTAVFEFAPGTPDEPEMSDKQPQPGEDEKDPDEGGEDPEPDTPQDPSTIAGDVNGDYRVNVFDISMLNGYIMGLRFDNFCFENADINGDGRINAVDVALVLELILLNLVTQ